MRTPIITLTTDFGLQDPFVAAMKGILLSLAPDALIVDVSHEIPAHDILAGGFVLARAFPYFPAGTIHVLVVDPGVGTSRPLLLARTQSHFFLGPDNGALCLPFEVEPPLELIRLAATHSFLPDPSPTFHGRDILAPVAARLSQGTPVSDFGEATRTIVPSPLPSPEPQADGRLLLRVILADRFGNLALNLTEKKYREISRSSKGSGFSLEIGGRTISRLSTTYGESSPGELLALFDSSGYLEVAVREGSAAAALGCGRWAVALLTC
ncbi:MAG TPA: SAM-dependent chlorinase/fluorinase [Candidatus Polarisedimenticolia bacterium]|nr:SAM-dependent chlorinase/fluorinase [Candidatus Polarisedimenticolia bacterium]